MEDVWNEINTLPFFNPPFTPNPTHHHDPILRDFFTAGEQDESSPATATAKPPSFNRCGVNSPFAAMAASSSAYLLESFMKKSDENAFPVDKKYKRMMKNRESAVRSRARKAAYTIELEKEKSHLIEENARLRRVLHGEELFIASVAAAAANEDKGAPKRRSHVRSLSALF